MIQQINHLNLKQEIGLKQIINHRENIVPIVTLNLKFSILRSNLCDHSDTYIHVKEAIRVPNTAGAGEAVNKTNKKVIFKNCAPSILIAQAK